MSKLIRQSLSQSRQIVDTCFKINRENFQRPPSYLLIYITMGEAAC